MPDFAAPVERLIDELKHLPGIGQKTAQRLAFFILRAAPEDAWGSQMPFAMPRKRSASARSAAILRRMTRAISARVQIATKK